MKLAGLREVVEHWTGRPVRPELVVDVEAEASVTVFASRLRPRVHRVRPDLTPTDL